MIALPWTPRTAPHLVLEVNSACNIACAGCYKSQAGAEKSVEDVMGELDLAQRVRKVQTVSLAGGEPTLHPGLAEIVRRIHARGLKTAVLTNGVDLSDERLAELADAGLDLVQLHIDEGQRRPDLPRPATVADVHALRDGIAARVAQHGMDAGLCVTLYPEPVENVTALVDYVIRSPWIHFLFASHYFDPDAFASALQHCDTAWRPATTNDGVRDELGTRLGLVPFACLRERDARRAHVYRAPREAGRVPCSPGHPPDAAPGWLTYLVPVLWENGTTVPLRVRSTRADMWPFHLARALTGRYVFYCKPRSVALMVQVLLNGACTGRVGPALGFLAKGLRRGVTVGCKRMVFDNGPRVMGDGRTECAELCPNATVRDGKLCGICTADIVGGT